MSASGPAQANRYVTHVVRPHETAESIAAEYYGNRAQARFITEFNGLPRTARLMAGQTVKIPTSYRYRMGPGETFEDLAQRLLGDRRKGAFLSQLSGLRPGERAGAGTEIQIPFHFVHQARPGESLSSIASTYYGDPSQARLLAMYNFRKSIAQPLTPGERVVVPITHVRVRSVRLPQPAPQRKLPPTIPSEQPGDARLLEAQLAREVGARVSRAERAYLEGNYTEVPAALVKLLAEVDPSEPQLIEIYRLLAFAYVALGETELAVRAFREVLDRMPDFRLDPVRISPKIRAALERAHASGS